MSCSLIHRALRDRTDRIAIPLVSWSGGLVGRAEVTTPLCVFGAECACSSNVTTDSTAEERALIMCLILTRAALVRLNSRVCDRRALAAGRH